MHSIKFCRFTMLGVFALTIAGAFSGQNEYSIRAQGVSQTAPVIDAAARQALDKMMAAYKNAEFYASDVKVTSSGLADSTTDGSPQMVAKISWAKPNKINIDSTRDSDTKKLVSDGSTFWETKASAPGVYLQHKALPTRQIFGRALTEIGAEQTMLARLIRGEDPLRRFGSSVQSVTLKKVNAKNAAGKMQIATDKIAIVVATARRKDTGTATFIVDAKTYLLRSLKISQTQNGAPTTLLETYENARIAPDDTSFEYSPSAGSVLVSAFPKPNYDPRLQVGAEPFPINARDLDGKGVNLKDYKGEVVLLDFWATWCPPCRDEAPEVAAMYQRNKDAGLNIIGISLDADKSSLLQFAQQNNMPWRQVFDGGTWQSAVPKVYGVYSIPFTVLVGRDGKIAAVGARGRELDQAVVQAIAAK